MKIIINDHRKINAIQEEFNEFFPYLKLEFMAKPHGTSSAPPVKLIRSNTKTLGECRTLHNKGTLTITPGMSGAELEEGFRDIYGLTIRLYRKSGKEWLGITSTDKWTLQQQNDQGKALSTLV
jgi:hypothetical protein